MAGQTEAERSGRLPHGCMSLSPVAMIAAIGVPSLEVGLAAAQTGLAVRDEHGDWHWVPEKLETLPETSLVGLLEGLRDMVGYQ